MSFIQRNEFNEYFVSVLFCICVFFSLNLFVCSLLVLKKNAYFSFIYDRKFTGNSRLLDNDEEYNEEVYIHMEGKT